MGFPWAKLFQSVEMVAPILLGAVNPALVPVAGIIVHAINTAQTIPGKTGAQKSAIVQGIVTDAVAAINTSAGKEIIPAAAVNESLQEGIDTVVAVQKVVAAKGNLTVAAADVPPKTLV